VEVTVVVVVGVVVAVVVVSVVVGVDVTVDVAVVVGEVVGVVTSQPRNPPDFHATYNVFNDDAASAQSLPSKRTNDPRYAQPISSAAPAGPRNSVTAAFNALTVLLLKQFVAVLSALTPS
jgi:hypothetical protein